ncbi:MAG: cell division ATP-binding protein FtsE [Eubacteriales bacterium]|nr:cell division ATP-binding protein FtsE [Eubacteriales bacterium]
MIRLINISASYNNKTKALDCVSLDIEDGEFVFIVGESGAGKTTLFKLFTKEIKPSNGDIVVFKRSLNDLRGKEIALYRRKLGIIFQDFKLLKNKNVFDNIAFPQVLLGMNEKDIKKRVDSMLSIVDLADKSFKSIDELSMGQQQKVAIARALINKPKIILADEPTGNLDPQSTKEIIELLNKINQFGTTVIVITHDMSIVRHMNKRVIQIRQGQVAKDGYVQ